MDDYHYRVCLPSDEWLKHKRPPPPTNQPHPYHADFGRKTFEYHFREAPTHTHTHILFVIEPAAAAAADAFPVGGVGWP